MFVKELQVTGYNGNSYSVGTGGRRNKLRNVKELQVKTVTLTPSEREVVEIN